MASYILSIDIGGTFIKYAKMDREMNMYEKGKVPTPAGSLPREEGRAALVEAIGTIYDSLSDIEGIAISATGIHDPYTGVCPMGGPLRYNTGFALRDAIHARCPVRITIENDAKAAAMAEATVGALSDVSDGFVLLFGTMIGGGYIKNHRLVRGKHFSAGEVSYITAYSDELPLPENIWGNRCSALRLCREYAVRKGLDASTVDGIQVFEAVHRGEPEALEALDIYTHEIAVQIFNLQAILDPERFAIGGGISAQPVFIDHIRKHLEHLYASCPYTIPHAEVVACRFLNDANLIGALQVFLTEEKV